MSTIGEEHQATRQEVLGILRELRRERGRRGQRRPVEDTGKVVGKIRVRVPACRHLNVSAAKRPDVCTEAVA